MRSPHLAPTHTWAIVPSQTVASGSGVEAASSSHSGVQMFPGETLGKGGENPVGLLQTLLLGLTASSQPHPPTPPPRLSVHGAAHQLTLMPH